MRSTQATGMIWGEKNEKEANSSPAGIALNFSCWIGARTIWRGQLRYVTYSGVTPDLFDCMKQELRANGIYIPPGESGELSGNGITADFKWDGESILTIRVKEKPFFVSCRTIANEIRQFAQGCQGE